MPSIEFPGITMINPASTTGVAINNNIGFDVPLVLIDAGTGEYAYPDVAAMRNATTGEFTQHTSNANLTGGYGIVRERLVETTGQSGEAAQGLADYPNDWGIADSFGAKIPSILSYSADGLTASTETAAVEGPIKETFSCYLVLNPTSNLGYNQMVNALLEKTLPYKTVIIPA